MTESNSCLQGGHCASEGAALWGRSIEALMSDVSAKAACLSAMEMMGRHGVSPRPHNYEIFYLYAMGDSPDLVAAVDALIGAGKVSQRDALEAVYVEYIAPPVQTDALVALSEKLSTQISAALGLTEKAALSSAEFGGSIGSAGLKLRDLKDPAQVAALVESMVRASTAMENQNSGFNSNLQGMHAQIASLQQEVSAIRKDALTDPLTNVGNRRFFDMSFGPAIDAARQANQPLSLCILDIDRFKRFNDRYGHTTGDAALQKVASILKAHIRSGDIVARYGGEEFVVILPGTRLSDAIHVVERVRLALASQKLIKRATGEVLDKVTASFGVTELQPEDTPISMLERADTYLYRAKDGGRNRIEIGMEQVRQPGDIIATLRASQAEVEMAPGMAASA